MSWFLNKTEVQEVVLEC